MEPLLRQVLEKYPNDVKLVIKHFPLKTHKMSLKAALAAMAAGNQGKFWEFHVKLYENFDSLSDEKIREIAAELNLDMQKFLSDQTTAAIRNIISRNIQNGRAADVDGTPAMFINGKRVKNLSLQNIMRLIEKELAKTISE